MTSEPDYYSEMGTSIPLYLVGGGIATCRFEAANYHAGFEEQYL